MVMGSDGLSVADGVKVACGTTEAPDTGVGRVVAAGVTLVSEEFPAAPSGTAVGLDEDLLLLKCLTVKLSANARSIIKMSSAMTFQLGIIDF